MPMVFGPLLLRRWIAPPPSSSQRRDLVARLHPRTLRPGGRSPRRGRTRVFSPEPGLRAGGRGALRGGGRAAWCLPMLQLPGETPEEGRERLEKRTLSRSGSGRKPARVCCLATGSVGGAPGGLRQPRSRSGVGLSCLCWAQPLAALPHSLVLTSAAGGDSGTGNWVRRSDQWWAADGPPAQ